MYDFVDRPVTSLDRGGRFLIWSMRAWVKAVGERKCPTGTIAPAFAKYNMALGLQPFLRMMALFNRHGLESFRFCSLSCEHISEHEAIILSLICSLCETRSDDVSKTLDLLVETEFVGDIIQAMTHLGQPMHKAQIYPTRPLPCTPSGPVGRNLTS
jgi:hypothetical protein